MIDETKLFWRGRPVEDLTKEELIEALHYQTLAVRDSDRRHQATLDMWSAFRNSPRALFRQR